jgi:hypothetical protein
MRRADAAAALLLRASRPFYAFAWPCSAAPGPADRLPADASANDGVTIHADIVANAEVIAMPTTRQVETVFAYELRVAAASTPNTCAERPEVGGPEPTPGELGALLDLFQVGWALLLVEWVACLGGWVYVWEGGEGRLCSSQGG